MHVEVELKEHIQSTYHQNQFYVKNLYSLLIKVLYTEE